MACAHEVSPRAILRYKSKATSFGCNTRGSIDAHPGVLSNRESATTHHCAIVSRIIQQLFRLLRFELFRRRTVVILSLFLFLFFLYYLVRFDRHSRNMSKYFVTILWLLPVLAAALPANDKPGNENDLMATIYSDCLKKESINCIKYKVFSYVDKMLVDKEDITLTDGITVVKTSNAEEGAPRSVFIREKIYLARNLRSGHQSRVWFNGILCFVEYFSNMIWIFLSVRYIPSCLCRYINLLD